VELEALYNMAIKSTVKMEKRGRPKKQTDPIAVRKTKSRRTIDNVNSKLAPPEVLQKLHQITSEYGEWRLQKLAPLLGVPAIRLSFWKRNDADFRFTYKDGLDKFNSEKVEKTLVLTALGRYYEETTEQDIKVFGKSLDGMKVLVPAHKTIVHRKYLPPNPAAIFFYLQNRMPERWKNTYRIESRSEQVQTSNIEHNINMDLSALNKNDLELLRGLIKRMEEKKINGGVSTNDGAGAIAANRSVCQLSRN